MLFFAEKCFFLNYYYHYYYCDNHSKINKNFTTKKFHIFWNFWLKEYKICWRTFLVCWFVLFSNPFNFYVSLLFILGEIQKQPRDTQKFYLIDLNVETRVHRVKKKTPTIKLWLFYFKKIHPLLKGHFNLAKQKTSIMSVH